MIHWFIRKKKRNRRKHTRVKWLGCYLETFRDQPSWQANQTRERK